MNKSYTSCGIGRTLDGMAYVRHAMMNRPPVNLIKTLQNSFCGYSTHSFTKFLIFSILPVGRIGFLNKSTPVHTTVNQIPDSDSLMPKNPEVVLFVIVQHFFHIMEVSVFDKRPFLIIQDSGTLEN